MEEKHKDDFHKHESLHDNNLIGKTYTHKCYLKIDISGETFNQIKEKVERAIDISHTFLGTALNSGNPILGALAKSATNLQSKKTAHNSDFPIKKFIQDELDNYCNKYIDKEKLGIAFYASIKNYEEREGSLEVFWDIAVFTADRTPDAVTQAMIRAIVADFYKYIKEKIKKFINSLNKSNCTIEGNCEEKTPIEEKENQKNG